MRKTKKIIFITLSAAFFMMSVFSIGFNGFGLYTPERYTYFADSLNSGVFGSIMGNRDIGFFHVYGIQTKYWVDKTFISPRVTEDDGYPGDVTPEEFEELKSLQAQQYLDGVTVTDDDLAYVYTSKVNLGGIFFSLLDDFLSIFNISQKAKYMLFYSLSIVSVTLLFVFIGYWAAKEFGLISALFVYASIITGTHIIPYGSGLCNSAFTYFLPFTLSLYLLNKEHTIEKRSSRSLEFLLIMIAISIKAMMGYEALPTIMVSATIPYFYYAYVCKWRFKDFIKRLFFASIAAVTGLLVTLTIHTLQLSLYFNSVSLAVNELLYSFGRRSWGNPDNYTQAYISGLSSSIKEVVMQYLDYLSNDFVAAFSLSAVFIIFLVSVITVVLIGYLFKDKNLIKEKMRKAQALSICGGVALIGALSTLVVLKAHSHWHPELTSIVFYLPFSIIVFALLGYILRLGIDSSKTKVLKQ